jgi:hypothetical protein
MTQRKFSIVLLLAAAAVCFMLASCSELKNTLPPVAPSAKAHPAGWGTAGDTATFHGNALQNLGYNLASCKECHGSALTGSISGTSCAKCHGASYPHIAAWTNQTQAGFHGTYLKAKNYNAVECQACHGSDFRGAGNADKSCYTCHASYPHESTWLNASSSTSHGQYVKTKSWNLTECASCHGSTYTGGTSGESCFACHSTYPHVANMETAHPTTLRNANYPLASCQVCHGTTYAGGSIVNVSCMTSGCHRDSQGSAKSPESCNVCHGSFTALASDKSSWAPPFALNNDSLTTSAGVGAHQKHLTTAGVGKLVKCEECHAVPATWNAAGHLNPLPFRAEVVFQDTLAKLTTSGGAIVPNPSYNGTTFSCANTYCHGNWRLRKATSTVQFAYADTVIVGGNASPVWTASAACGTCHGLPPTGHVSATLTACVNCHSGMIDATGTITDKTKHVNGKINVFGAERPML